MALVRRPRGYMDLRLLDELDIRGELLVKLFTQCCESNEGKIERTMSLFRDEVFTPLQIHSNLKKVNPIPFIDESVNPEGTPDYPERIPTNSILWINYCKAQKKRYNQRLKTKTKKTNVDQVVADISKELNTFKEEKNKEITLN